jgi:hypothetical protein
MGGGLGRAATIGAVTALLVTLFGLLAFLFWSSGQEANRPLSKVLVIATVPSAEGGEVAALAFVADATTLEPVVVLDTLRPAAIPGTSARTARDAYPYGGGDTVARALAQQTDGNVIEWVVLPAELWSELVDQSGGALITAPQGLSSYVDGRLTVVEPGENKLTGSELAGLAAAVDFFDRDVEARKVLEDVTIVLHAAVTAHPGGLRALVASGTARSSVASERLPQSLTAPQE